LSLRDLTQQGGVLGGTTVLLAALLGVGLWMLMDLPDSEAQPATSSPGTLPEDIFDLDSEQIILEDFQTEITEQDETQHRISASWARLNESDEIIDMKGLSVEFYSDNRPRGEATSGYGRIWLEDSEEDGRSRNDLLLSETVRYYTIKQEDDEEAAQQGEWVLETPLMLFTSDDSTLRSDKGYVKQMPMESGALGSVFSGEYFDRVRADRIQYDAQGSVAMRGNVRYESQALGIVGQSLAVDTESKVIQGAGDPLWLHRGVDMQAQCGKFVYDTEAGRIQLTEEPVVYQLAEGKVQRIRAGVVNMMEDESGRLGVSLRGGPGGRFEIDRIDEVPDSPIVLPGSAPKPAEAAADSAGQFLVGRGERFEIKVNLAANTFDTWTEYTAILEKTEQPVILP